MIREYQRKIVESVRGAMDDACKQAILFTDEAAEPIAAEYIFTVAVAASISKHNGPGADPFLIRLERDAGTFLKDCFRPFTFDGAGLSPRPRIIRRGEVEVDREGRVDVTVYADIPNSGYMGTQPLCAIEVKGFDPSGADIRKDLERNLCFMKAEGATGNVLACTIFAALHSYRRFTEAAWFENESDLRHRYEGYVKALDLLGLEAKVVVDRISAESVGRVIEGLDYDEWDTAARHHVVGVMVIFSR